MTPTDDTPDSLGADGLGADGLARLAALEEQFAALRAPVAALGLTVESLAEGRTLDQQSFRAFASNYAEIRHIMDDPANPRNLRDETTRAHTRIDGVETRQAERTGDGGGWRAALAEALAKPIDAVGNALRGLPKSVIWALCLTGVLVALIVTNQLVPLVRALRGVPETTIEAPRSIIAAPDATIHP